MEFVTSHFGKMNLWPVEHFYNTFILTFGRDCYCIQPKSEDKYVVRVFINWSEVHLSEITLLQNPYFRQIHIILAISLTSYSKFVKLLYAVWAITFKTFFQVWELYRRNFHKGRLNAPTRKTCIRQDKISTGNPCPICRDEYLLVDYQNLKLIEQFVDEYSGLIYPTKKTGVCQQQNKKILLAIDKARDLGILTIDQPFVEYDYSKYNR